MVNSTALWALAPRPINRALEVASKQFFNMSRLAVRLGKNSRRNSERSSSQSIRRRNRQASPAVLVKVKSVNGIPAQTTASARFVAAAVRRAHDQGMAVIKLHVHIGIGALKLLMHHSGGYMLLARFVQVQVLRAHAHQQTMRLVVLAARRPQLHGNVIAVNHHHGRAADKTGGKDAIGLAV